MNRAIEKAKGELLTIRKAAEEFGVATSTVHRWLDDGIIQGKQHMPGAPWRIHMTDELRSLITSTAAPVASGWSDWPGGTVPPLESSAFARRTPIPDAQRIVAHSIYRTHPDGRVHMIHKQRSNRKLRERSDAMLADLEARLTQSDR